MDRITGRIETIPSGAKPSPSVTRFELPSEDAELARLKRLTGLDFSSIPRSLLHGKAEERPLFCLSTPLSPPRQSGA